MRRRYAEVTLSNTDIHAAIQMFVENKYGVEIKQSSIKRSQFGSDVYASVEYWLKEKSSNEN